MIELCFLLVMRKKQDELQPCGYDIIRDGLPCKHKRKTPLFPVRETRGLIAILVECYYFFFLGVVFFFAGVFFATAFFLGAAAFFLAAGSAFLLVFFADFFGAGFALVTVF